jgi:hypothetical protein
MQRIATRVAGLLFVCLSASLPVAGQPTTAPAPRPTVRPTRVEEPPVIDGALNDAIWSTSTAITDFVQQTPLEGVAATEQTRVLVAYDSQNLYLGFQVRYTDPAILRANRVDRDQADQDDLMTVYLDPFLDQQRAYVFDVNGYGVQGDGLVLTNTSGGTRGRGRTSGGGRGPVGIPGTDRSWDALFFAEAAIVEDGYTAEMAIPFKSLRYPQPAAGAAHRWGFQIVRSIGGKNDERDVWSPMSRDVTGFLAQMGTIEGMTGFSTSRNLELLPTVTALRFESRDETTGATATDFTPEAGLNIKYGVSSNLTADITFNPDFSQIETDLPQVAVNQRFPLFFPELRPFFLEGQEIFRVFSPLNWLNTRTIVDPRYGAKLTGKVGRTAVGLLVANDAAPGRGRDATDPAAGKTAQVFVGRARYDLYPESYVGTLVTDRQFVNGYSRAAGVDAQFRLGRTGQLNFIGFQTLNREQDGAETSGPAWGVFLQKNGRNLRLSTFNGSTDPDLRTDLGFIRRVNTHTHRHTLGYRWWSEGWLINWGPRFTYERIWNYDWIAQDERFDTGLDFTFARNVTAGLVAERALERFADVNFWKWTYGLRTTVNASRRVGVSGSLDWGDQIFFSDQPFLGRGARVGLNVTLRPVARLQSDVNLTTSRLVDTRGGNLEVFDIKLLRGLTTFQFTERLLLRNITQYDTFAKTLRLNLLATYRINSGTAFFLGYDDHYRQRDQFEPFDDEVLLATDLLRTNRAVFMKVQYLFRY